MRRCYKTEVFKDIACAEIHHFSDASQSGYGQCSYLRLGDEENRAYCSLVIGKVRVAPLKVVTVISIRMSQWLKQELTYPNTVKYFWSDSQVILRHINNFSKSFHVYVVNRIQDIHNYSILDQWHYVEKSSRCGFPRPDGAPTSL